MNMRTGLDALSSGFELGELEVRYISILVLHVKRAQTSIVTLHDEAEMRGWSGSKLAIMCLKHSVMTSVYTDEFEEELEETVQDMWSILDDEDQAEEEEPEVIATESEKTALLDECIRCEADWPEWETDNLIHQKLKTGVDTLAIQLGQSGLTASGAA